MLGRYVIREVLVPYLVGVFLFAALLTFDRTLYRAAKKEGLTVVRVPPLEGKG